MSQETLKFKVKFQFENEISEEFVNIVRDDVESFFQSCHGGNIKYEAKIGKAIKLLSGSAYEENIYELNVSVTYYDVNDDCCLDNNTAEICRKWCAVKKKHMHCWLIPERSECFYYEEMRFDSHMKTCEFAFGTLPYMGCFVQHYHYNERRRTSEIMSSFFHSQRYFSMYFFPLHNEVCSETASSYIFKVKYESIGLLIVDNSDASSSELLFQLKYPPSIYFQKRSEMILHSDRAMCISDASKIQYHPERYERALAFGCECSNSKCTIKRIGNTPILKLRMRDKYRVRHIIHRLKQRCDSKMEICFCQVQTVKLCLSPSLKSFTYFPLFHFTNKVVMQFKQMNSVDVFNCQYSWMSMFCHSLAIRDQVLLQERKNPDVVSVITKKLALYFKKNVSALVETLFTISEYIHKNMFIIFSDALDQLYLLFCRSKPVIDLPSGMCLARRVIVTPSQMIYLPPTEHFDNRVIRKFGTEYMLRISFQDDNFSKLTYGIQYNSNREEFMEEVVGSILRDGLAIGLRHYEVLASSNSQLREHGLWLYAKDNKGNTAARVRDWLGDFVHIRNVAKYMARMGQCFSTSEQAVQLSVDGSNEVNLQEIKTPGGRYTFSDGIGTISSSLANEVRDALRKVSGLLSYEPSAFQIRYKGCKGMITENPTLEGRKLGIRPSMKKFECTTSSHLEIVKISAPRRLFLNRPLITILEQLGISSSVFLKLQRTMILQLIDSLISEHEALNKLSSFFPSHFEYAKLQDAGISLINEPFFRSMLLCICKSSIVQLRLKGRIGIPPQYGRNMLGVLDETGKLKYGQVFVQYSKDISMTDSCVTPLEGTVVVTKNPCMHPGDVRKFEAVVIPELMHIKDCIVFPSRGKRPHPDEMAGSDLDGDEYVVMWFPDLIFSQKNYCAMEYPVYKEVKLSTEIEVDDMIDFLCRYIENDNIGVFANAHLAWADQHPEGIFSDVCMAIAKKYPYVLDFAKTGKTELLSKKERPYKYPDFMEKGSASNSYYSTRSLGFLYRTTRHLCACVSNIATVPLVTEYDPCLCFPGWEEFKDLATDHKTTYESQIYRILNRFGARSEAEVLCNCIEGQLYNQNKDEKANIELIVKAYVVDLMNRHRLTFHQELHKKIEEKTLTPEEAEKTKFQMASAWYMVAYGVTDNSHLLGFPWVISDILSEVRMQCLKMQDNPFSCAHESAFESANEKSLEEFVSYMNVAAQQTEVNEQCKCTTIGKLVLKNWLIKTDLIRSSSSSNNCCSQCLMRIFSHTGKSCCTSGPNGCTCLMSCSSLKFIMAVLKFYMSGIDSSIGICTDNCDGFSPVNLQSMAMATLANLSFTKNVKYLGVPCEHDDMHEDSSGLFDMEGDIIRIPVKKRSEQEFYGNYMSEVKKYLKKHSGVKEVYIDTEQDASGNWYLLINSIGRSFQRWNLEDLVLNPHFIERLQGELQINCN